MIDTPGRFNQNFRMTDNEKSPSAPKFFWWAFALLVAAGVALRAALYAATDFSVGDAFIGFRFAEQFAAGHGLVFNTGEWVGGNTSALHTLLVGLGASLGASVPLVAHVEGIGFDVAALFVLWNILRGGGGIRSPWLQLFVLAVIFLCPYLFWYSVCGLETTLYLLLIYYLLDRTLKKTDWQWFLAVALLFFCRPDGVIPAAAALLHLTVTRRKIPWTPLFGTFFIGLAYLTFNYLLYHTAIPPTIRVKSIVYHSTALMNFQYVAGRFFFHQPWLLGAYLGGLLAVILWRWKTPAVRLLGVTAFGYVAFLLLAPMLRTWYCAPFLALSGGAFLLAACGFAEEKIFSWRNGLAAAALAVYLAGSFFADRVLFRDCRLWRERIHELTEAEGNWFLANTPADATVFLESLEVGYFSKRHTWDWPGLVSPQVLKLAKENPKRGFFDIAERLRVDYVIIHAGWFAADETNIPPNFEKVVTFQSTKTGPVMDYGEGKDFIYQRLHD